MKVKIEKELSVTGTGYFHVQTANGVGIKSFAFRPYEDNQKIWGEQVALDEAMAFAKLLEQSKDGNPIKEIIYETPEEKIPTREEVESTETI